MSNVDNLQKQAGSAKPQFLTDPVFVAELRRKMLRFSVLQLSDEQLAEDAVQEALIGAFKNINAFEHRAALKTWVFAILKNKIIDIIRDRKRHADAGQVATVDAENELQDTLFDARGFWQVDERPLGWSEPLESVKSEQFWRIFEACLGALPDKQARLFSMREFLDFESEEICEDLQISTSNLHVMLHRARLRLRECLEDKWFTGDAQK